MPRRFVLLDRDGTINADVHYLSDPKRLTLERNAAQGLRALSRLGFGLAVVTNQSGIGRGRFDAATLESLHRALDALLFAEAVRIDGYFFCPHRPDERCPCRKPRPGLAEQAQRRFGFSFAETWVIGDKDSDVLLGRAIGARTLLVRSGKGRETEASGRVQADAVADDLLAAAEAVARIERLPL